MSNNTADFTKELSPASYHEKLKNFIESHHIQCEHLVFNQSCHSVPEAAQAAGASVEDFVKNICFIDEKGKLIVAIVKGEHRASSKRVAKALQIQSIQSASPEEMLKISGYPCGGTPSFGFDATFIVDPTVLDKNYIYTGGGSEFSLVKIAPDILVETNNAKVTRVRK